MNFAFSDEQEELRAAVRRFLTEKSPETEVRRLMDTTEGYDPAVWSQMADQLGLQSLTIPEEFGGSGFTYVELLVVLEEMGAALLCAPFFSSVALGANALLTSGDDEAKKSYLPGIASGETIATLAITEDNGKWDFGGIECKATKKGDGWVLDGHKMFVIDGHVANLIIVAARTAAGVSLFAVQGDAAGLTRTPLPTMDQTRKQARLEFSGTPATLIGTDGGAEAGLTKTLDLAAVALAAEQVGGAQRVLDASVEYAKTAHPVRPAHRQLPGHQAQVRRHAARGRVGQVRRVLRRLGRRRRLRRAPGRGQPGQVVLLRGLLPRRRREHPDPRRDRLHVGAPGAPLLQAGQVIRAVPRRSLVPPGAAGATHRHLRCRGHSGSGPGRRATCGPTPPPPPGRARPRPRRLCHDLPRPQGLGRRRRADLSRRWPTG